jgi:Flp pilus assembly protein TadD
VKLDKFMVFHQNIFDPAFLAKIVPGTLGLLGASAARRPGPVARGVAAGMVFIGLGLAGCTRQNGAPAASLDPGTGVLNVADAAIAGNDPAMALQVSQSVLATDPRNIQALYHEAAAYYAVGRCEDAVAAYRLALGIAPNSTQAETGIGRCLLRHDAAAAERAFMAAVRDDPENAAALNDLGVARDLQGNYAGATQPYQQALLVAPGALATEVDLGMSLALSGNGAEALQYLGPLATGTGATPKIREDYAAALLASGRTDEARQVLAVDLPPDQVNLMMADLSAAIAAGHAEAPPPPAPPAIAMIPAAQTFAGGMPAQTPGNVVGNAAGNTPGDPLLQ